MPQKYKEFRKGFNENIREKARNFPGIKDAEIPRTPGDMYQYDDPYNDISEPIDEPFYKKPKPSNGWDRIYREAYKKVPYSLPTPWGKGGGYYDIVHEEVCGYTIERRYQFKTVFIEVKYPGLCNLLKTPPPSGSPRTIPGWEGAKNIVIFNKKSSLKRGAFLAKVDTVFFISDTDGLCRVRTEKTNRVSSKAYTKKTKIKQIKFGSGITSGLFIIYNSIYPSDNIPTSGWYLPLNNPTILYGITYQELIDLGLHVLNDYTDYPRPQSDGQIYYESAFKDYFLWGDDGDSSPQADFGNPQPPISNPMNDCSCSEDTQRIMAVLLKKYIGDIPNSPTEVANFRWENGKKPATLKLSNIQEILEYQIKNNDEILGHWDLPIEIEDADPNKKGNQKEIIYVPNIAEAFGEMYGLLIKINNAGDLNSKIGIRTLTQVANNAQVLLKVYHYCKTILESLNIGFRNKSEKLKIGCNLKANDFDEIAEPSEIKVPVVAPKFDWNIKAVFHDLLHAASIIRAIHWRQINPNSDIKSQLDSRIRSQENTEGEEIKEDFDAWANRLQRGFSEENVTNKSGFKGFKPRIRKIKPRIRKIKEDK